MKKSSFIALILIILLLSACDSNQQIKLDENLLSTDLSSIIINDEKFGDFISNEKREELNNFDGLSLTIDDNDVIQKIHLTVQYDIDETIQTQISINGTNGIGIIDDVTAVLGKNYNNYWYDREQGLKANTYSDKDTNINITFVYSNNDNKIVWIIFT